MIGSLTTRIFAIFWLTLALVLMLVLMVPKLDSRQMTSLLESEQRQGIMIEQHVEAELSQDPPNDLMWWRRLFRAVEKWAPPGQRLLLVTSEGRVIGAQHNEMQVIRNFIGQSDNADHPQKKKYGRVELVGPFAVRDGEDNYQLYMIRPANSSQLDFVNLLFDRPLLLLIVTMLISSPLLLWLAWSLARPARKLKYAADEVASGNLRQHPELESGPQEFLAAGSSFNQMVSALERMMTRPPFTGRVPVFVGDDLTDECGFAAANRAGGWSVLVGARTRSAATHALAGPGAVHAWLLANAGARGRREAATR